MDRILRASLVMRPVKVVKRRDRKHNAAANRMQPGKVHEIITLIFDIVQNWRCCRINRHLIVIASERSHQPKLVGRVLIEDERSKSTLPRSLIVNGPRPWSLQPQIGAVSA